MTEEEETVYYAKFVKKLAPINKIPETFTLALSVNNMNLQGDRLHALVELLNRNIDKINKLEIILSCYLQHHYIGEAAALDLLDETLERILPILEKLDAKIELTIIPWKNLYGQKFDAASKTINERYASNECFQTRVDNVAKSHITEKGFDAAKNYTLEETAAMAIPNPNFKHLIYPSVNLPAPVLETVKVFNPQVNFHGYTLFALNKKQILEKEKSKQIQLKKNRIQKKRYSNPPSDNSSSDEEKSIMNLCDELTNCFVKVGIINPEEQSNFFADYVKLKSRLPRNLTFQFAQDKFCEKKELTHESTITNVLN